MDYLKEMKV